MTQSHGYIRISHIFLLHHGLLRIKPFSKIKMMINQKKKMEHEKWNTQTM